MAVMNEIGLAGNDASTGHFLNRAVWALFNATKNQSIKFSVWGIPVSVKVEKFRPVVERWVGLEVATPVGNVP